MLIYVNIYLKVMVKSNYLPSFLHVFFKNFITLNCVCVHIFVYVCANVPVYKCHDMPVKVRDNS